MTLEKRTIDVHDYQVELDAAYRRGLLEAAAICRERAETLNKYTVVSASEDRDCAAAIERRAKEGNA